MTNGYIAFYRAKRVEVHAETSYAAQQAAMAEFQKLFPRQRNIKGYDISVTLAEVGTHNGTRSGEPVIHTAVN
jgi:hypothetical protein